ncbi:histone H1 [Taklimakanibacter lacteus]|uniref:histone H1 n=1 Tax=Taklimakanibacter lacteus TaxID=2268456 RepID=UPI0034D53B78
MYRTLTFAIIDIPCHTSNMAGKSPKRPRDANELAKRIVDLATGDVVDKKPLASARKGGIKGSKARYSALTPEHRSEIARGAAAARWKKDNA